MNPEKILEQISINKLDRLEYPYLIAQLCVLNNRPYEEIKVVVDDLLKKGKLELNNLAGETVPKYHTEEPEMPAPLTNRKKKEPKKAAYSTKKRSKKEIVADYYEDSEMLDEAYKMLKIDPRKSKTKPSHMRVEGKISATTKGYAFLVADDSSIPDIFIPAKSLKGALHGDRVIVETMPSGKRVEGKVLNILERANERVIGKIKLTKTCAYVTPDDVKFGMDVVVPLAKTLNANNGEKVVVTITNFGNKSAEGIVTEVLGMPNAIETEVKAIIRAHNLYETFPKKVQEVAEQLPTEINIEEYRHRKDLTEELIFTIDGEDTRDIDDAISIKTNKDGTYTLGVHIADVGEYVRFNNVIDQEAFKRGTSVYFPGLVLPMLPRELSNGICSLNEMVNRLAISVFMDINDKGDVINHSICESVICSKKRFTYTEVQKIIERDKETCALNEDFNEAIWAMDKLAKILMKKKYDMGYINFEIPEVKIDLDDLGNVTFLSKRASNDSTKLIEAFMVAANETIAEHYCKLKAPFVYRIHETPSQEKMNTFLSLVKKLGVNTLANPDAIKPKELQTILTAVESLDAKDMVNRVCLRSLRKAKYSQDCLGHFGLASEFYCHFTSPIRRYPDLTIHRIIKDDLHGELVNKKLADTKNFVIVSSINSSEREVVADDVERDVDDLYKVFYMKEHLNEEFDGKVSGVTSFGIFVELENTVEGMIAIGDLPDDEYEYIEDEYKLKGHNNTYTIGMPLRVKSVRADILSREIDFVIAKQ